MEFPSAHFEFCCVPNVLSNDCVWMRVEFVVFPRMFSNRLGLSVRVPVQNYLRCNAGSVLWPLYAESKR